MATWQVLNIENPLFLVYVTWCSILILKTILMSLLTVFHRRKHGAMISSEDCTLGKDYEVKQHEDIERVRRAHLNDLENVWPFLVIGLFYIFTDPHVQVSSWLFRIVGVCRIAHTIIYAIYPVRQPTRAILFYIVYIISLYMSLSSVVYFFHL